MDHHEAPPWPHDADPPAPRFRAPAWPVFVRGLGLLALMIAAIAGIAAAASRSAWLLAPAAPVLGLTALLAGWAAAIHLTGGEKFDDNPCV